MRLVVTVDLPHATEDDAQVIGRDLVELLGESVAVGAYDPIDTADLMAELEVDTGA